MMFGNKKTTIPPFNDLTAPLEDTKILDEKGKPTKNKSGQFKIKEDISEKQKV